MRTLAMAVLLSLAVAGSGLAGERVEIPNPLAHVKAGQWVQYRLNTLFGAAEQKQSIVSVQGEGDERLIVFKSEMTIDGEAIDAQEGTITYRAAVREQEESLRDAANLAVAAIQAEVKGEQIPAVRVTFSQDGKAFTLDISERIPILGVIRLVEDGATEPAMELMDFGG